MMKLAFFCCSVLFCCSIFFGCGTSENENAVSDEAIIHASSEVGQVSGQLSNYNFEKPSETFIMDEKLGEISSLAYDAKEDVFMTNNDENGNFFILDPQSFKIKSEVKFAKKGDYESIEKVDDNIIICKNTGKLYFYNTTSKETNTYKNELSGENDVEGLCYHKESHSLLLACKGQPLDSDNNKKKEKSIYRFDLEKKELITEPFLTISDDELKSYITSTFPNESKSKVKQLKNKVKEFAPSGIAIHPVTRDYFITSARESLLVIIDKNKALKGIIFLNHKTNPQPEGICFDKENNLYISTEGKGFSGKVFKFDYNG